MYATHTLMAVRWVLLQARGRLSLNLVHGLMTTRLDGPMGENGFLSARTWQTIEIEPE